MATSAGADQSDRPAFEPGKPNIPPELFDVGVSESLDTQLPLQSKFRDHTGREVRLGDYVDGVHPTVIVFAYHTCPVLCGLVQEGVVKAMRGVDWNVGEKYNAVTISIDPRDTPDVAAKKREQLVGMYGRAVTDSAWAFLTTPDNATIEDVTRHAGWHYYYNEDAKQYAHPSAIVLLKPNGKIARYLYGIDIDPKDFRLGLIEASEGRSVSTIDRALLYCYRYDGHTRTYSIMATRVMQIGGGVTVVVLGSLLTAMWLRERKKSAAPIETKKDETESRS
jgi:protein SCO1/2